MAHDRQAALHRDLVSRVQTETTDPGLAALKAKARTKNAPKGAAAPAMVPLPAPSAAPALAPAPVKPPKRAR